MSNIHHLPQKDQRHDEASRWIAKLDEKLSAEDTLALQAWMAANSENAAVLLKMAELWDQMDSLSRLSDLFPESTQSRPVASRSAWAAAASVLVAVGFSAWYLLVADDAPVELDVVTASAGVYETAVGEKSLTTLEDGTEIILNTDSLLRVQYSDWHRLLILERGEIHVRVANDTLRPLSVFAEGTIVQAVGTEFNVEITDGQRIELVVTEGKVRVGVNKLAANYTTETTEPQRLPPTSRTVTAGEELILGVPDERVAEVTDTDIEVKLSWQSGNLIFRGEPLEDAIEEIGRYTSVEFVIVDEDLKKVRVAGMFKAGDVDGLLAALRENFDIANERVDEKTVLLSGQ